MSVFVGETEVLNRAYLCRKEKLNRFQFNLGLDGGIFSVGFLFAKLITSLERSENSLKMTDFPTARIALSIRADWMSVLDGVYLFFCKCLE